MSSWYLEQKSEIVGVSKMLYFMKFLRKYCSGFYQEILEQFWFCNNPYSQSRSFFSILPALYCNISWRSPHFFLLLHLSTISFLQQPLSCPLQDDNNRPAEGILRATRMEFYGVKLEWVLRWDWDEIWSLSHRGGKSINKCSRMF